MVLRATARPSCVTYVKVRGRVSKLRDHTRCYAAGAAVPVARFAREEWRRGGEREEGVLWVEASSPRLCFTTDWMGVLVCCDCFFYR